MINLLSLIIIIAVTWIAVFFALSPLFALAAVGVTLFTLTIFLSVTWWLLTIFWLIYGISAVFLTARSLRFRYILVPNLTRLRKQIPAISNTEKEAIEAGDTWWEKELFCGTPRFKNLWQMPAPKLTAEEEDFLANQVDQLCAMVNDWQLIYKDHDLPEKVWQFLKQEKFFGMVIPKAYGGLGFSALAHSTVVTKISTASISTAVTTMVPNSLGPGELMLHYGTTEQKDYYLPRLANGLEIPCFALTAPEAGSDAGSIPDTGVVCRGQYQGQDIIGIRLNFDKRYITLAPVATLVGIAFQLLDPEQLIGQIKNIGITLCVIPANYPGIKIGNRHYPMHLAFMNGPVRGKDVFVPLDFIIGGSKMAGQGWRMLMENLSIGRSISLPALSTGCGIASYQLTGAYARIRKQFNTAIANFGGIEEALGYIAGYTYLLEATRLMTAGAIDQKINPAIVSAIAKYQMTELGRQVLMHAMDIHAGHAIQIGPRNILANMYLGIPISITVEGANILTRNLIIFGQGAIRCHPYLLREIELISAETHDLPEIDKVIMQHAGFYLRNLARSFAYGISCGKFIFATIKQPRIKKLERQLVRMSSALALLADSSLILLGGSLKRKERISARLGDILSQLYLASAALKLFYDHGQLADEIDYVHWSLQMCLAKIQDAIFGLLENFPNKTSGFFLKLIIFPFGRSYSFPSDELHKSLVKPMTSASPIRTRLIKNCYHSESPGDIATQLELALNQTNDIEDINKKLQIALQQGIVQKRMPDEQRLAAALKASIITEQEAATWQEFEKLKKEIIKVNEFTFDLQQLI